MSDGALSVFDKTVHEANTWLKEISNEMNHPDEQIAYHALRGVLFALRDRIPVEEALDLSSQLPVLIRGIFFEGYKISDKPEKYRDRDEFLNRVNAELEETRGENPENASKAVFKVLGRHVSKGEVDQVCASLPEGVRDMWVSN